MTRRSDLAYLVVRIGESFIYPDLITGEPSDEGQGRSRHHRTAPRSIANTPRPS
ncbi:QsdR family transcriptional regulator [Nonomuraea sp. NPDC048916]|uniref:QsdR family transcriptional regulator n=1 Tax=Nonomuraea sp. NPDC048916 TaxID=3154232 RepID=UPI0033E49B51